MATAAGTTAGASSALSLSDFHKRWLVFGIALNKILAPSLRPYVEQGVIHAYGNVTASHSIHTQSTSGRLKKWPRFLNYENINGNDAQPRLHGGKCDYALFDCRVTLHVDFAKLYLQTHMVKFSAFDERCDASALLVLLSGVPGFYVAVQAAADDVRDRRNAWAHCDFSDWDAVAFQESFQMMEQLVKALGLPSADEGRLLSELKTWETTGTTLCMNSPVDPDLLHLIQHHVNTLQGDLCNLTFELEKQRDTVRKALQECATKLQKLETRVSKVETKVSKVETRVSKVETDQEDLKLKQMYMKQEIMDIQNRFARDEEKQSRDAEGKKPKGKPPEFLKSLESVEVVEGSATKLECRLTAKPEPSVEWLKDGKPVKTSKSVKTYFDSEVSQLMFSETVADGEGEYKCVATNELGTASCSAELLVSEAFFMPEFKDQMKHVEIFEGDTARFDVCVVGNPKPNTVWSKRGKTITNGGRFKILKNEDSNVHSLLIENAAMDDVGGYKCAASNEVGRIYCFARIDVKERKTAPELSDEYGDSPIDLSEGGDLKINVTAQGNPRPDVEWYKDDKLLRRTSHVNLSARGSKFGVVILGAVPEDSRMYKCVAKSAAGTTSRTFQVNVKAVGESDASDDVEPHGLSDGSHRRRTFSSESDTNYTRAYQAGTQTPVIINGHGSTRPHVYSRGTYISKVRDQRRRVGSLGDESDALADVEPHGLSDGSQRRRKFSSESSTSSAVSCEHDFSAADGRQPRADVYEPPLKDGTQQDGRTVSRRRRPHSYHGAIGSIADVYSRTDRGKSAPASHLTRGAGEFDSSPSSSYSTHSPLLTTVPYQTSPATHSRVKLFTKPFAPSSTKDIQIGMEVLVTRLRGQIGRGVVKYVGPLPGRKDTYIGVELGPGQEGKHDGFLDGERLFHCEPNRGIFVSFNKVVMCY